MIKISVLVFFIFLFIAGCKNNTNKNINKSKNSKLVPKDLGIDFDLPQGWNVTHKSFLIVINEDIKNNTDDFNEAIIIRPLQIDTTSSLFQTCTQLRNDSEFQDEGLMQQFFGEDTIEGRSLFRYSYNSLLNNANNDLAVVDNYIFTLNAKHYIVSTRCLKRNQEKYKIIFNKFLKSIS